MFSSVAACISFSLGVWAELKKHFFLSVLPFKRFTWRMHNSGARIVTGNAFPVCPDIIHDTSQRASERSAEVRMLKLCLQTFLSRRFELSDLDVKKFFKRNQWIISVCVCFVRLEHMPVKCQRCVWSGSEDKDARLR